LRPGIARGRSCATVLVVPRRKQPWMELSIGGRPWPELELYAGNGKLVGEGRDGDKGEEEQGWLLVVWGGGAWGELRPMWLYELLCCLGEEGRKEKREKRKEEREGKKEKEKKSRNFSKLEKFWGENKRQFMKLV
jgi:hypothetical protein